VERIGDFRHIHNVPAATTVLMIACDLNDWEGAEAALYSFDHNFSKKVYTFNISMAHHYYEGRRALFEKDYRKAAGAFMQCNDNIPEGLLPYSAQMLSLELWSKGQDAEASTWSGVALAHAVKDPISLYNAGVTGWWLSKQSREGKIRDVKADDSWKQYLQSFLVIEADNPGTAAIQAIARQILAGSYNQKPVLLYPQQPKALSYVAVGK
jgi:hypothetical protein